MKKRMIMLLAAALLVVTGCKKDDKNPNDGKMIFNAGIANGNAKTEINDVNISWIQGDVVKINGVDFTADRSGAVTTLSSESEVEKLEGYYHAYFPASISSKELSSTQTYNGKSLSGVNPMYAKSETTDLTFHSICALVELDVTGSGIVISINVSADQPLRGSFEIDGNEESGYYAKINENKGEGGTLTLTCGAGVSLSTEATSFYIALPANEYTNLKFTINDNDDNKKEVEIGSKTLVHNTLYTRSVEFVSASTHAYVDLGLPSGLLWATCNVGANSPEEYGDYFAWGETSPYYSNQNPITWKDGKLGGYCWQSYCENLDFVEWNPVPYGNDNILTCEYDAASVNWGGEWKMPTNEDWQELIDNTESEWTNLNGVYGQLFTSKIENHIGAMLFLPASGCFNGTTISRFGDAGGYWSSSLFSSHPYTYNAYIISFASDMDVNPPFYYERFDGFSIRPVHPATK